jgi:tRNA (guanine26-N2/guanine27-N2)-dimethyltransferase
LTICEALAASGLRSIRYIKEIKNIKKIVANDLDPNAVEMMRKNFGVNNVDQNVVEAHQGDAA